MYPTNVLLIDGSDQQREYYAVRLIHISSDYVIHQAGSGEAGLALYKSQLIDCVVLEIDLPDMSGFALLVNLIPVVHRPKIAVIVLTRLFNPALLELAIKNGAQAALHKPMTSPAILEKAIRTAVNTVQRDTNSSLLQRTRS